MDSNNIRLMEWDVKLPFNMLGRMLMINHPPVVGAYETAFGDSLYPDHHVIPMVVDWWKENKGPDATSVIWGSIAAEHQEFRTALDNAIMPEIQSNLARMFAHPVTNGLAQGSRYFDHLVKDEVHKENTGAAVYDKFITLFEAVGIIPTFAPEDYEKNPKAQLKYYTVDTDKYIQILEDHFKADLKAPPYQGCHFGIKTSGHGIYSDRDIMSIFTAIRIHERYGHKKDISICDLGGGVGHLAYYLTKLGFTNITLVEVPTVAAAAVYFLETNLPGHNIQILPIDKFNGDFSLVINADGITGFGEKAKEYAKMIKEKAGHFYSVNKETDPVRVGDLFYDWRRVTRTPFWLRRGYVEEDYVK